MITPATNGVLRAFIPSKDYELSRRFYQHLGWSEDYSDSGLSVYKVGNHSFYLQSFYNQQWSENCMMFLEVEDVSATYEALVALNLPERFPGSEVRPPKSDHWGDECFLIDPSGVLWHFGKFND